jgi:hypothetical protein
VRTRDWATVDFYEVLGVAPDAPTDDVAGAFRSLAKRLHPDRPDSTAADTERFTTVVAAYEVLGNARLRRAYDDVRAQTVRARRPVSTVAPPASAHPAHTVEGAPTPPPVDPVRARRNARRWLGAGIAVFLSGVLVSALVLHLQAHDRARRAGRQRTEAVFVADGGHTDVRFATTTGATIQVPEPTRIDPGTDSPGTRLTVLYRPDRPTDVIADESTTARDITLWIVALKLLVGGIVFTTVGVRRRRRLGAAE